MEASFHCCTMQCDTLFGWVAKENININHSSELTVSIIYSSIKISNANIYTSWHAFTNSALISPHRSKMVRNMVVFEARVKQILSLIALLNRSDKGKHFNMANVSLLSFGKRITRCQPIRIFDILIAIVNSSGTTNGDDAEDRGGKSH